MTAHDHRSILITGASSGIGRAAALALRDRGWRVFATARTQADLASLADDGVTAVLLDYAKPATIAAAADHVLAETGGRLFALFNNGAYGQPGAVEDLRTDVLRAQFEANFFGWHDLTCRVLPAMRAAGRGRIVQCSSVLGLVTLKYRGAYSASKFALEGLTDTMRIELRGSGVRVSTIEPGPIATRFVETSMKMLHANVDLEASPHAQVYATRLKRMARGGAKAGKGGFKLPPGAVVAKLVHALESDNPRPRYFVTTPTWFMAIMRRVLPSRALDALTARISDNED